ncbi:leucine--tRNA ligase, putative [Plasmodium malariae]|uniref:leucine--tRNA ligase n=1 Tax=Plasmodium malariae TaxID=5858 RepID=A0A1C3KZJ7_PLAMA|nr:leucine--tRNA ligase, putative [Plasmodium malariae]
MKQMNIGDDEIHLFQNPEYWCYYFSSKAKEHLKSFGLYCDWRRSFITTNMNQYYDKFVNWQFNTLYKKNLIYYGSRITIFSRVNNQACADHERSEGEGVKCQEYTLIKIYVHDYKEFYTIFTNTCRTASSSTTTATAASTATMKGVSFSPSEEDRHLKNEIYNEDFFKKKKIILLGSTLKPETAYGQNYTFVNPNDYYYVTLGFDKQVLHYGDKNYVNNILTKEAILEKCENIYICSENSLYNMAYQGIIPLLMRMDKSNWGGSADGKTATSSDCSSVGVNSSGASANNKLDNINDLRDVLVLCKIKGESLIGLRTYTNLSKIKNLYILPMTTIKMNVSTAIVPCVSSDSTDDYACLEEIRKKKNFYCEKYNLKEEYLNNDISDDTSKISKNITTDKLKKIRREFQYWYPFDVRISGKDLIFNHLTMALFNHVAIWGKKIYKKNKECHMEEKSILDKQNEILNEIDQLDLNNYETIKYFPKSFFCNGHVLVNKEKMSKSKGNFITIEESIGLYTSDGTRIALADAGDSIEDANFNTDTANSAIMKLYNLINFCIETKNNVYIFRCGEKTFNDRIFENEINYLTNKCKESYEKLLFRDVLKYGFYDMLLKRDTYRIMCDKIHMHKDTVNFFIERICIIINPIIPHITEHIWTYILKKEKFLINQKWPPTEHTNFSIVMHKQYNNLLNVVEIFRKSYDKVINKNNKQKTKSDTSEVNQGKKSTMSVSKSSVPNNSMIKSNETNEVNNHKQQPEGQCKEMINKNGIQKGGVDHVNNVNVNPCVGGNTNVSNDGICKNYEEENYKDDEEEGMKFKAIVYVAREYNDTQKKIIDILNSIINNSEDKKLPSNYINLLVQNPYVNNLPKNEKKEILSFATFLVKDNVTLNNNQYELTLPYDEIQLIKNNVDFMKRSLNLGDIQVLENTKKCEIDNTDIYKLSNPGNPSIFMYNVES